MRKAKIIKLRVLCPDYVPAPKFFPMAFCVMVSPPIMALAWMTCSFVRLVFPRLSFVKPPAFAQGRHCRDGFGAGAGSLGGLETFVPEAKERITAVRTSWPAGSSLMS